MMLLPSLMMEMWKAVICHGSSIWCCNWCGKRMNETTSVCVATGSGVFLCPLFYGNPVQKLQAFPFCPYSRSKQDQKLTCGFMFQWRHLAIAWCFWIIKINASLLSFLSLQRGFNFQPCAIAVSVHCKTSRDASKDHYLAFPLQNRRCCVEFRNVR
jgi:hypothetical protein